MTIFAQGDLLFVRIPEIPADAPAAPDLVLALGEATGHSHRAVGPQVTRFLAGEGAGNYLRVGAPTPIVHEEHSTITLSPGCWHVRQQVEFPLGEDAYRTVAD